MGRILGEIVKACLKKAVGHKRLTYVELVTSNVCRTIVLDVNHAMRSEKYLLLIICYMAED